MGVLLFAILVLLTRWTTLVTYLPADAQSGIGLALVLTVIFGGFAAKS
ncbi:hypothetical protein SAZ10_29390 [Mesorhizobium sp. BAC0120]|nr:hypothetical protein [Mesorhizobium sp. BAC0120]MDW6025882.1 hypothetical protein [Mesorhizobium sp. BAC0120]